MAPRTGESLMASYCCTTAGMFTTKLSHLTIILLDHFDSARDIQRSSRRFENRYLWHGSLHRYDLLTTIVGDKEVSSRSHFGGVFRYLAKFKMSDSSVDSNVADAINEFAAFTIAAPRFKQFTNSIALLSFAKSTSRIVEKMINQCAVDRKLFRSEIGKCQVAHL
jgi:hypothetical protein